MSRNADFPGVGLNPDGCRRLCVVDAGLVSMLNKTFGFVIVGIQWRSSVVVVGRCSRLDRLS